MIHRVMVLDSALKHGFAEHEIVHAWCNCLEDLKDYERSPQSVHVRIGVTPGGALVEMLAAWSDRGGEWQVFHAMRPRTGLMSIMGLKGGNGHGRKRSY